MQIISHCQKHFVVNAFFITIFDVQNRNIVPLCFLLSMVRAGHTKILSGLTRHMIFLLDNYRFKLCCS